jgi:heme exporter protein D
MPDNAVYYQMAYAATIVLYVGYAATLVIRRRALAARRARQQAGAQAGRS